MRKIKIVMLAGILVTLVFGSYAIPVQAAQEPLSMVIFPRRNVKITHRLFQPLAQYLSVKLDREVRLVTPGNFEGFWHILTRGDFDLVHLNQYHFIVARERYGLEAILKNVEFGSSSMRGVIAVRKDSGLQSLQQLKGKKILFGGGRRAMISYIVPTMLLRNAGLNKGDYRESFAKNPPNAYISVFHKHAQAVGTSSVVTRLNVVTNAVDVSQMKVLAEGPELPQLPWAVTREMPVELRKTIQRVLSNLSRHAEGQAILDKAQLSAIEPATNEEYAPYRDIILRVQPDALSNTSSKTKK